MPQRRFVLPYAGILFFGGIFLWVFTATAPAQVSGSCSATMNGVSVNSISTTGTALRVPYNGSIAIDFESSGNISRHDVWLEFFKDVKWRAAEGSDNGNSWSDNVAVADYSRYGVGLYRVTGSTFGANTCSGSAYVKVTGKNPLTTAAGAGAAAATALGVFAMAGSALTGMTKGPQLARQVAASSQEGPGHFPVGSLAHLRSIGFCLFSVPVAIFQSLAFMLAGAGAPGVPVVRVRGGIYLSVSSILGSLLAGLGTLVLGQQFALFFPSLTILIIWMIPWLVAGMVIPSLARLVSVRKANSLLNQWAMQQGTQPGQGLPPQ